MRCKIVSSLCQTYGMSNSQSYRELTWCTCVHTCASAITRARKDGEQIFLSVNFPGHTAVVKILLMLLTIIANNYIIINEAWKWGEMESSGIAGLRGLWSVPQHSAGNINNCAPLLIMGPFPLKTRIMAVRAPSASWRVCKIRSIKWDLSRLEK